MNEEKFVDITERAAAIYGEAKRAGIGEDVLFCAIVAAVASKNPMVARLALATVENGVERRRFATAMTQGTA